MKACPVRQICPASRQHPEGKTLLPPQRTGKSLNAPYFNHHKIFKLETVVYYATVSLSTRVPDIQVQRNSPLNIYSSLRRIRACRAIFLVSAIVTPIFTIFNLARNKASLCLTIPGGCQAVHRVPDSNSPH